MWPIEYRHNKIEDFASYNRTFGIKCAVVRPLQSETVDHRSKIGFIWSINFQKHVLSVNCCRDYLEAGAAAAATTAATTAALASSSPPPLYLVKSLILLLLLLLLISLTIA